MRLPFWLSFSVFIWVFMFQNSSIKPPKDNLKLYLPDDLEATLWAESPMLYNPTNMDVDVRGRIWVTEAVNYRNYNNDSTKVLHHQKGDRVVILEDTNHDGKADKSTVFTEDRDLVSPLGIAVIGNKVVVSCSPHLIVYTDENGDDKPDKKEILLTGFGGKDHDHSLHSVVTGPDGKWYFNVGNAGPHEVTDRSGWTLRSGSIYTGGSPYNEKNSGNRKSDDGKIWVGGLQLRVNPDGTGLKVLAHGFRNSYETCVDSYGDMWQNDNDDQVVACRVSWLMEGGNAGFFSEDGTRYWFADQRPGQDMFTAHWHQEDPGFMYAGDNTGAGSPTGITLNEGNGLGKKYRGILLSADAGRNVIFSYLPKMEGSGYSLEKQRRNLITSVPIDEKGYVWNDSTHQTDLKKWFRPSDVMIGADGAMYIADWYDPVVGGHVMRDEKGYGRIYRITPRGQNPQVPIINLSTLEGQLEAFKNPAVHVRALGFEALRKRGMEAAPAIAELLKDENPYIRARALFLLAQLDTKGQEFVWDVLQNGTDNRLRLAAFRALKSGMHDFQLPGLYSTYTADPLLSIRREVAIGIGDFPRAQRQMFAKNLFRAFDGRDPWYLDAIGRASEGLEEQLWAQIIQLPKCKLDSTGWNDVLSRFLWRIHPKAAIPTLLQWAGDPRRLISERRKAMTSLAYIDDLNAVKAMLELTKSPLPDVAETARYWLAFRQTNMWAYATKYVPMTEIDLDKERKLSAAKAQREKLLNEHIADWDRQQTAISMAKDSVGGQILIGMMAEKKLSADLLETVSKNIFNNPDLAVRIQAGNYFKRPGSDKIWRMEDITRLKGHVEKGKKIFQKSCATCHKMGDEGKNIGPDMTHIRDKYDRTGLLDAIINPAAGIVFGYESWLINTKDGGSNYGFLLADGDQVIIRDLTGQQHTIAKDNISKREKQPGSIMPAPIGLGLSEQDLADLTEFLLQK
jgi:putative membrane-bound dehydrogenase-like protein